MKDCRIQIPTPHRKQLEFIESEAKRKVVRAGRRSGKTEGFAILAIKYFLASKRVLYGVPTQEQVDRFWTVVTMALQEPIQAGVFVKNETKHQIELPGTETRIRAKTCWNANTLRGDYADLLLLDEFQLMNEDAWELVGIPMLLDNNGDAAFGYTPPSLHSRSVSKARDPQHAARLYKTAEQDKSGRWKTFHFTSYDNPYISGTALSDLTKDMTSMAIRMEIMAEDVDEVPGALWNHQTIEKSRVLKAPDSLSRVIVGVDPTASSTGDEAGIITAGKLGEDYFTLADDSMQGSPQTWARAAVTAYYRWRADCIVAEKNNGGEMVEAVIKQVDPNVNVRLVWASRGKAVRAEPIAAIAEQGRDHHVGVFPALEDELCMWLPGDASPNRLDAKVWALTELSQVSEAVALTDPYN